MIRAASAYVILYAAIAAWAPFLQPYYLSLGIPLQWIGLLVAFSSAMSFAAAPVWGAVNDHFPQSRWLIPLAAVFAATGATGMYLAGASPLIVPAAGLWAVGMAGTVPMMDVRVLSMVGANRTRYGWIRACGSLGFMVFAPIVGTVVDAHGPASLFVMLVPAIVLAGAASTSLPVRPETVRGASMRKAPGVVLRNRTISLYLIGTLAAWMAVMSQNSFFSIYLEDLGAPASAVGWTWTIAATLEVPIMFGFPWLAKKFGLERLILAGAVILVVRQLANTLLTAPELLVACSLLQGAGYGMVLVGGIMFVSTHAPRGTAATAQGMLNGMTGLSSIIGAGLGGQIAGLLGIRGLFAITTGVGVLAIALLAIAVLPVARASATAPASETWPVAVLPESPAAAPPEPPAAAPPEPPAAAAESPAAPS